MLQVYNKIYNNKIGAEVSYYFLINGHGLKKYYEVSYELISDINYEYSRYIIELQGNIKNIGKIENDMILYTPLLFSSIKAQRRLAVLSKFVLYVISIVNNIPIYRIPKKVEYYHNGVNMQLSVNAFIKTTYALIPRFEKIYRS